jgi:predicted flap endonuclease-1-like 5' DNA nuclease
MRWWMWLLLFLVLGSLVALIVLLSWLSRRRKQAAPTSIRATSSPTEPTRAMPQVEETPVRAVTGSGETVAKVKDAATETAAKAEELKIEVQEMAAEAERETKEAVAEVQEMAVKAVTETHEVIAETEETAAKAVTDAQEMAAEAAQEFAAPAASLLQEPIHIEPQPSDDLKIVEGIGPKISSVLQAAGITTWAQLAATDVDTLKKILREADIRLGDPTTWPEQAALAAEEKWDELTTLQDSLKGGRRVAPKA